MGLITYVAGNNSGLRRLDNLTLPWIDIPLNLLNPAQKVFLNPLRDVKTDPSDANKVFTVGNRLISTGVNGVYYSTNKGAIWNHVTGDITSPAYDFAYFYEVWPVNTSVIYTCGDQGYVFKSLDGGLSFNKTLTLPTPTGLPDPLQSSYALHFISPLIGVVSLESSVYKTSDGGISWAPLNGGLPLSALKSVTGIHMSADEQTINALGNHCVYRSIDGGLNWSIVVTFTNRSGLHLTWIDDNNLWGLCNGNERYVTNDAGATWVNISVYNSSPVSNKAGHLYDLSNGLFSQDANALVSSNGLVTGFFSETSPYGIEAIWNHFEEPGPTPCGCPEGFTYNAETNTCIGFEVTPVITNGTIYRVAQGNRIFNYGSGGTNFYENVTAKPKPLDSYSGSMKDNLGNSLIITNTLTNNLWGDIQLPDTLNGRLNVAGIWTNIPIYSGEQEPTDEWIGFTTCVNVTETKTYYIGLGADNQARFKVNSVMIAELTGCYNGFNFNKWHVFPITLNAGINIIELEGYNCSDYAAFAAEIYDTTLPQLLAMTLEAQLNAVILFSTKDKIGSTFDLGTNSGYSCPEGWSLSLCTGVYQCVRNEEGPFEPCNCYLITDCTNRENTRLITSDIELNVNLIYVFEGYPDMCWTIELSVLCKTDDPITIVTSSFETCLACAGVCYELTDCEGIQDSELVSNDLSALVGRVIKQNGCPDKCWIVSGPINCGALTNVITIIADYEECSACLPKPVPEPPLTLKPRTIQPGYTPPVCNTDYIHKVNCTLAEAVFQQVASKRYGLEFCCAVDLNKWWIKKEMLDLKSIYDPNACVATPIDCCPPCNVIALINIFNVITCPPPTNVTSIII